MTTQTAASPLPVLATLAGLALGTMAGEIGEGDPGAPGVLVGPIVGAVVGSLAAGAAAVWSARRGALARTVAAGIVGLVLAGGGGMLAATELWQETHEVRTTLHYPPVCIERVGNRGQRCRWAPDPRPRVELVGDSEEVRLGVAAAGGIPTGIVGASLGAFLEAAAARRRRRP